MQTAARLEDARALLQQVELPGIVHRLAARVLASRGNLSLLIEGVDAEPPCPTIPEQFYSQSTISLQKFYT